MRPERAPGRRIVESRVLGLSTVNDDWRLIRLAWDDAAPRPGQYVSIRTPAGEAVLPIRAASEREGWIAGVLPPDRQPPDIEPQRSLDVTGPAGRAMKPRLARGAVLFAEDSGIGPLLYFAEELTASPRIALLGSSMGIPGRPRPSRFMVAEVPTEAIASLAALEDRGYPCRLAVPGGRPGCYDGEPLELLRRYAADMSPQQRAATPLIAFVPTGRLTPWRAELAEIFAAVHEAELPV